MKVVRIAFLSLIMLFFIFSSCSLSEANKQQRMSDALERHIRWQNEEEGMKTQIELASTVSYESVNKGDTAYIAKVYLVSKSWYIGGNRVYNTNDTIRVYYADNMAVLKMETIE